jgi:predicted aspartyl protease
MKRVYSMIAAAVVGGAALCVMPACQTVTGKVPSTDMEVSAGQGNVAYRAADTGTVYVYNQSTGNLVYRGDVMRGQVVLVDTGADRVLVDNRPVVEHINLDSGNRYQIFLDAHQIVTERRVLPDTTTVVERRPLLERREVVVPKTTYEKQTVVVPKTTYEKQEVVVPSGQTVERRTYINPQGQTVIEQDVRDR